MIKFFRTIRKSLLMENLPAGQAGKTSKYFKYAVGEIVLVVIGILIALQINNWNQASQNNKKEKEFLKEMHKEFLKDKKTLDRFTLLTSSKIGSGREVIKYLKGKNVNKDTLLPYLFFNGKIVLFRSFTPIYDELISSGQMNIIKSDSLKTLIKDYKNFINISDDFMYKENQSIKEKYNLHLYKYFDSEIITALWDMEYGKSKVEDFKGHKLDFNGFLKDSQSYYYVSMGIGVDSELNRFYKENISNRLNNILLFLEKEVKND